MNKVKEEFKEGKNGISYVNSDFIREYGNDDLTEGKVISFSKLPRIMNDTEIIKEFSIQECTLGDVLETITNTTPEMKDGYSNLFYIKGHPSHVVYVYRRALFGGWGVGGWNRDFGTWNGGERVFSLATGALASELGSGSVALTKYCECPRCLKCSLLIK